jgi:hypothetical protein
MGLLQELNEMGGDGGVTDGGDIAVVQTPLFKDKKKGKKKHVTMRRLNQGIPRLAESLGLNTDETRYNAADVISKLDAAEKKAKNTEDTVTFGMEDEEGNVVKVYVRSDQAKEFEHALGALLSGQDNNSDEQNTALEIAEVLFELKNKFDIIDVDWGVIPSDEEEEQEVEGGENPEEMGMDPNMEEMPPEDGMMDDGMGGGEDAAASALQQVIDLLKAQAEAEMAEAEARTAEAKAKEAEYTAIASKMKVKQEEEVLDMESYYKKQAEEKKEAKQIAKLAKYKHDLAQDAGGMLDGDDAEVDISKTNVQLQAPSGGEENEEVVSPSRLAELIFGQMRGR